MPHREEVRDRFIETSYRSSHFSRTYTSPPPTPNSLTKMTHAVKGQQRQGHRSNGLESGFEQLSSNGWNKDRGAFGDRKHLRGPSPQSLPLLTAAWQKDQDILQDNLESPPPFCPCQTKARKVPVISYLLRLGGHC